jgi:hypothetical protein
MTRCEADHSIFSRLASRNSKTKDLGPLKYYLGIEVVRSSSVIAINQRKYAVNILIETGMLDCRDSDTLMDPNVKLLPG